MKPIVRSLLSISWVVLPTGCSVFGLTEQEQKALDFYSNQAQYWYDNGRYREAIQQGHKGLKLEPGNYKLNLLIGLSLLQLGGRKEAFEAQKYLDECSSQNWFSGDWKLDLCYGIMYHRQGKFFQLAKVDAENRATQEPDPIQRSEILAKAKEFEARMTESYAQAISYLDSVSEEVNQHDTAVDNLQQIYANLGQYQKALDFSDVLLEQASRKLRSQEEFMLNRETTAPQEDLVRDSHDKIRRRVAEIRGFRAHLFFELGRYDDAITELDEILLRLEPGRYNEYFNRAECKTRLRDRDGATRDYVTFIRRSALSREDARITQAYERLKELGVNSDELINLGVEQVRDEIVLPNTRN